MIMNTQRIQTPRCVSAPLLVLLLIAKLQLVVSFAPSAPSSIHKQSTLALAKPIAAFSSQPTLSDTQETSAALLQLLQQEELFPNDSGDDSTIKQYISSLISSKSYFDPATCIGGPLFASVYFIGDTPGWAKISVGGVRNVKGQKYTALDDTTNEGILGGTFVNYAEIVGSNFYLKAFGDWKDVGSVVFDDEGSSSSNSNDNPFDFLTSLFNKKSANGGSSTKQQSKSNPTPYDYSAAVKGASIVLFDKFTLDVPIEGTGTVRVLYADENLRIFLSPTDTNVTRGGGDWESEGLIVVQVRVDLVYDDWVDNL